MNSRIYADLLAKTYNHTVSAWRPLAEGGEKQLCEAAPCALSRAAHTSAPTPPDGSYALPEAAYRLSLFTRPELWFALGDRVEITDRTGRVFHGRTSDSFCYPSHCVTVVEVREIGLPAQSKEEPGKSFSLVTEILGGTQAETVSEAFALGRRTSSEASALSASAGNEGCGTCEDVVSCEACPGGGEEDAE